MGFSQASLARDTRGCAGSRQVTTRLCRGVGVSCAPFSEKWEDSALLRSELKQYLGLVSAQGPALLGVGYCPTERSHRERDLGPGSWPEVSAKRYLSSAWARGEAVGQMVGSLAAKIREEMGYVQPPSPHTGPGVLGAWQG